MPNMMFDNQKIEIGDFVTYNKTGRCLVIGINQNLIAITKLDNIHYYSTVVNELHLKYYNIDRKYLGKVTVSAVILSDIEKLDKKCKQCMI